MLKRRTYAFLRSLASFQLKDMSTMQRLAFVAGLGGGLLVMSLVFIAASGGSGSDTIEERYVTWSEANKALLVDRGLLPSFAPRTSTEITVRYRPESNQFRGTFRFPISDGPKMKPKLADMPAAETEGALALPQPYDAWWPAWLAGPLEAGPKNNPGYSIHRPHAGNGEVESILVACNFTKGHCVYWSDTRDQ